MLYLFVLILDNQIRHLEYNQEIHQDILDYLNSGNHIITAKPSNKLNSKAVKGARAGNRLSRNNINPLSVSLCNKVSL